MKSWLFISKYLVVSIILLSFTFPVLSEKPRSPRTLLVPFDVEVSHLEDIARESTLIMKRKLELGESEVVDLRKLSEKSDETITPNPQTNLKKYTADEIKSFAQNEKCDWIVTGKIINVYMDPGVKKTGAKVIGFRRFPITSEISAACYSMRKNEVIYEKTEKNTEFIPRFSFLGFHGNPFPESPRTIDSVVHAAVVKLAREINRQLADEKNSKEP
jgi:hypothetical protein